MASTPPIRCGPRPCGCWCRTSSTSSSSPPRRTTATRRASRPCLELLDNQRFARGTMPDRKQLGAVMVRRLKSELPPKCDGSPRFPKRVLEPLEVPYTAEEKADPCRASKQYTEAAAPERRRQRREVRHRVRAADAQEAALLQPGCLCHHAGAAREVAADGQDDEPARPSPPIGILQRQIDRVEEEYADDEHWKRPPTMPWMRPPGCSVNRPAEEAALLKQMREWAATRQGPRRQQSRAS